MEIEYKEKKKESVKLEDIDLGKNVTDDYRYLNQNMTVQFGDKELAELEMLMKVFSI